MKFKSPLMSTASGKLAGIVASHNRYGSYFRKLSVPVNPQSAGQVRVRQALESLTNMWHGLGDDQRQSWLDYASNIQLTGSNASPYKVPAFNHYIRSNSPRYQFLGATHIIQNGPTIFNLGTFPTIADDAVQIQLDGSTAFVASLAIDDAPGAVDEEWQYLFFASKPQNNTRIFRSVGMTYIGKFHVGASSAQPTAVVITFPADPAIAVGAAIWVKIAITRGDARYNYADPYRYIVQAAPPGP